MRGEEGELPTADMCIWCMQEKVCVPSVLANRCMLEPLSLI